MPDGNQTYSWEISMIFQPDKDHKDGPLTPVLFLAHCMIKTQLVTGVLITRIYPLVN